MFRLSGWCIRRRFIGARRLRRLLIRPLGPRRWGWCIRLAMRSGCSRVVPRWKWRALAVGVVSFVAASWLSMVYLGPTVGVAFRGSVANVFGYQGLRASEWTVHELAGNHSFFTLAKFVAVVVGLSTAALS